MADISQIRKMLQTLVDDGSCTIQDASEYICKFPLLRGERIKVSVSDMVLLKEMREKAIIVEENIRKKKKKEKEKLFESINLVQSKIEKLRYERGITCGVPASSNSSICIENLQPSMTDDKSSMVDKLQYNRSITYDVPVPNNGVVPMEISQLSAIDEKICLSENQQDRHKYDRSITYDKSDSVFLENSVLATPDEKSSEKKDRHKYDRSITYDIPVPENDSVFLENSLLSTPYEKSSEKKDRQKYDRSITYDVPVPESGRVLLEDSQLSTIDEKNSVSEKQDRCRSDRNITYDVPIPCNSIVSTEKNLRSHIDEKSSVIEKRNKHVFERKITGDDVLLPVPDDVYKESFISSVADDRKILHDVFLPQLSNMPTKSVRLPVADERKMSHDDAPLPAHSNLYTKSTRSPTVEERKMMPGDSFGLGHHEDCSEMIMNYWNSACMKRKKRTERYFPLTISEGYYHGMEPSELPAVSKNISPHLFHERENSPSTSLSVSMETASKRQVGDSTDTFSTSKASDSCVNVPELRNSNSSTLTSVNMESASKHQVNNSTYTSSASKVPPVSATHSDVLLSRDVAAASSSSSAQSISYSQSQLRHSVSPASTPVIDLISASSQGLRSCKLATSLSTVATASISKSDLNDTSVASSSLPLTCHIPPDSTFIPLLRCTSSCATTSTPFSTPQKGDRLDFELSAVIPMNGDTEMIRVAGTGYRGRERLHALCKGILTRRLMNTVQVQAIIKTIKDTDEFLTDFNKENLKNQKLADRQLRDRMLDQLWTMKGKLHDILINVSVRDQLKMIANSRKQEEERGKRQKQVQLKIQKNRQVVTSSAGHPKLSAASQKAIKRRQTYANDKISKPVTPTKQNTKKQNFPTDSPLTVQINVKELKPIESRRSPTISGRKTTTKKKLAWK